MTRREELKLAILSYLNELSENRNIEEELILIADELMNDIGIRIFPKPRLISFQNQPVVKTT